MPDLSKLGVSMADIDGYADRVKATFSGAMTSAAPSETVNCSTCHRDYDPADESAVKEHTEPLRDCVCNRCRNKPSCYMCGATNCFCSH